MVVTPSQPIVITRDQTDTDGFPAANTHTAILWKNGAATGETVTPANPATGVYSFAFTIPADADQYDVWSLRVVDGDGYAATVWEGVTGPVAAELDSAAKLVLGSLAAQHFGAIANAGTGTETYVATAFGQTFTVTHSGLESDGDRAEATRVAS